MATLKNQKGAPPTGGQSLSPQETGVAIGANVDTVGTGWENVSEGPVPEYPPRFHFFVIDSGWKTEPSEVLRDNFHMIRVFQNSDPLYMLTREQSITLIHANPDLIGKDPILLVHDLHAQGGQGETGYHGFRLCLGLINNAQQALAVLQKFLRFVQQHRGSEDIEKHIRDKLHRKGLESAIEVIRESMAA